MKKNKRSYKKYKFTYIKSTLFTLFICLLFVKGYTPFASSGNNLFHVIVNGQDVGTVAQEERAEVLLIQARRNIASRSDELVFMEAELSVEGEEMLWGYVDDEQEVLGRMEEVLQGGIIETMQRSYTLKVNNYIVSLASLDEVVQLLQAAVDKYDSENRFRVELAYDANREFSVLAPGVEAEADSGEAGEEIDYSQGGIASVLARPHTEPIITGELGFEDYELGILTMDFAQKVEIVETYLPQSLLTPLEEATNRIIMEQETPSIYEVKQGDTLSEIALTVNIPMDKIVEMNDSLETVDTTLQIGQELIITVPEPELSVTRVERNYYDESYDAEVEIIEVDTWYTDQTEVLVQPSAGFRRVVADVSYVDDKEVSREILKEEVVWEAVAKVMKRGTKIRPTYLWPIYGGRKTSPFGRRTAPKKGASTNHKGVDLATPTGTPVYASCGGTVTKAGWGSGYGYVVYIDHEGGRQTRYGHLSKVLVSVGQKVKQGDRIALSGNTGVSTAPHLHFELRINGTPVDPEKYVKKR
ncbi:MAG: M23 family metallopeptidase [Firmicutes bacterium]|nr:M23 family metallopeptidase [Bacillota bacterium]